MFGNKRKHTGRKSERGNVFFTLFGAVAIVGVLGAGVMATMRGPLSTMVNVNRRAQAEADMNIASKLILLQAVEDLANGGDCDLDNFVEPMEFETGTPAPTGGGHIPGTVASTKSDPWGTPYGYCAWDAGDTVPVDNIADCGGSGANRLAGADDPATLVMAVISAGPNQQFETTCASGPPAVTKGAGSDDFSSTYTYATAVAETDGLWSLNESDPNVAEIAKDIAAQGATFTGDVDLSTAPTAALRLGAASMFLPTQAEALDSDCDTSPADDANHGILRINTATDPDTVEVCDAGTTTWQSVAAGAAGVGLWKNDGPGGVTKIYYDAGNVGIGIDNPTQALDLVGSAKLTDDLLFDSGSAITWGATGASLTESAGNLDLVYSASSVRVKNTGIDLTGDTTITGSTADDTKAGLEVKDSGAASLLLVRNDGNVGIGDATPDDSLSVVGFTTVDSAYKIDGNVVLKSDTTMADSIFVGNDAAVIATGDFNTVVGGLSAGDMTDGTYNVLLGAGVAPTLTEGDFNIIIGAHDSVPVDVPTPTSNSRLNIGNTIYGDLANDRIGIGNASPDDALDVTGDIDATGSIDSGTSITAANNITATTGNIEATLGNISAPDGSVRADSFLLDGITQDFSDIADCDDSNDKIIWTPGTGWGCGTDLQGGSGGGGSDLADVLGLDNDAETLDALNFGQVGAVEFCNEDLSVCFNPEDVANGSLDAAISALTDADADNTIDSADWNQTWNWQLTGGGAGLAIGETAASTGGASNQYLLSVGTLAASTATPLQVDNLGTAPSFIVTDEAADTTPFLIAADGDVGIGTNSPGARLHVVGGHIRVDDNGSGLIGTNVNGTNILAPNNGDDMIATLGAGGNFLIHDAGNAPQILLGDDGRVGIGDMTPDDGTGGGGQLLVLDVNGATGASHYCDGDGLNCFTAASISTAGIWERNGTVVRTKSPVDIATDDFVFGSTQLADTGDANHDARMFFDKSKSAFRVGNANGTQWDDANVGSLSTAFGGNPIASGSLSIAMGSDVIASNAYAVALGRIVHADGINSTAIGYSGIASGINSIMLGRSVVAGNGTAASGFGDGSMAVGLMDDAVTITTRPQVTGIQSLGIFMGDQDGGVAVSAANVMALAGGRMVIDPNVPATQTNVSTGVQTLELDVEGDIGAVNYCDKDGNNCFTPAGILTGVTPRLSSITAATADNSINNGNWNQVWNWQLAGAETGFTFGENTASAGGAADQYILSAATLATSTATPLFINNLGAAASFRVNDEAADATPFLIDDAGNVGIGNPAPAEALDIVGNAIIDGNAAITGNLTFDAASIIDWDSTGVSLTESSGDLDIVAGTGFVTLGDAGLAVTGDTVIEGSTADNTASALELFNSTPTSLLKVQNDGLIGIGDFSADTIQSTLHIQSGDIRMDGGAGNEAGCIRFDDATDTMQFSNDCTTFADMGGADSAIFERSGTLVRPNASVVTLLTDDFVFGAAQLADIVGTDDDKRMFFDKSKGAFRAGGVDDVQWDDADVGSYSIALGGDVTASDNYAIAMGRGSTASGWNSTAIGNFGVASGTDSIVLGRHVVAGDYDPDSGYGDGSMAIGLVDDAVTVSTPPLVTGIQSLGIFMGDQDGGVDFAADSTMGLFGGPMVIDPNVPATQLAARGVLDLGAANDALVLPNGTDAQRPGTPVGGMFRYNTDYTTNDKLEYYDAESAGWVSLNVGTTTAPFERSGTLVRSNASVVTLSTDDFLFGSTQLADTGDANHDSRMFFDKSKGAFRAGSVAGVQWDNASVGNYSTAIGRNTTASGANSTAMGTDSIASGAYSTAMGDASTASGVDSIAIGFNTTASGINGVAMGRSVVAGNDTAASGFGDGSMAMGLMDDAVTITTRPQVTGIQSLGIFMGDQDGGVIMTADSTMGLFGGTMVIDPNVPATQLAARGVLDLGAANDALVLPNGTDAQRPGTPVGGMFRYNTDYTTNDKLEYYDAESAGWVPVVSGTVSSALSAISAAGANNSINNGNWNQVWNWQLAGAETGFTFGENTASAGGSGDQYILSAATLATSTATPLFVNNLGAAASFRVNDEAADATPFLIDDAGNVGIGNPAPAETLDVVGNAIIDGNAAITGNLTFDAASIIDWDSTGVSITESGGDLDIVAGTGFVTLGDAGLAVTGDTVIEGSTADNTASALELFNSTPTSLLKVQNDGLIGIGDFSADTIQSTLHIQSGDIRMDGGAGNEAGCIRFDDATDAMQFSNDCTSFTDFAGASAAAPFERSGTLVRPNASVVTLATDDFVFGSPQMGDDGDADHDSRMFFDKSKGAFRAGIVTAVEWEDTDVGDYSIGMGYGTIASGTGSIALGNVALANSNGSVAIGNGVTATGDYGVAIGNNLTASGDYSVAMGTSNASSGYGSTATGVTTIASGNASVALGYLTTASGENSLALGSNVISGNDTAFSGFGDGSMAVGLIDDAVTITTRPQVTGIQSLGVFMGDQDGGIVMSSANTMGLFGGTMVIDPNVPATQLTARGVLDLGAATTSLVLPRGTDAQRPGTPTSGMLRYNTDYTTNDKLEYYDAESAGWVSLNVGTTTSIFERSGTLIRPNASAVTLSTDDFVFGSTQLADTGSANNDSRFFFDKSKGAFRAGLVTGTEWDDGSVGTYSAALGNLTIASGTASTASGSSSTASGNYSVAIGQNTIASGNYSIALGRHAIAGNGTAASGQGDGALAIGLVDDGVTITTAPKVTGIQSYGIFMGDQDGGLTMTAANTMGLFGGTMVIDPNVPATQLTARGVLDLGAATTSLVLPRGTNAQRPGTPTSGMLRYNTDYTTNDKLEYYDAESAGWVSLNVGSATSTFERSGTLVRPNASVVTLSTDDFVFGSTQLADTGSANNDSRFFFDKSKGAFRAGLVTGVEWDDASVGTYSVAMGNQTIASGTASVAIGSNNSATGNYSIAIGNNNTLSNNYNFVLGSTNATSASGAVAIGQSNTASGNNAVAIGISSTATGSYATAIGNGVSAIGNTSTALGYLTTASGYYSTALGNSVVAGNGTGGSGFGDGAMAIGLISDSVTLTTRPQVRGDMSLGIFMGDQDGGLTMTAASTMGLFGGTMVIDPNVPATQLAARGVLDLGAATTSVVLPRGTDAQRPGSPTGGMLRYNTDYTTNDKVEYYDAESAGWVVVGTGSGGATTLDGLTDAETDYAVDYNMFLGSTAGNGILAGGQHNIALGQNALDTVSTGDRNIAIGYDVLTTGATMTDNIGIGYNALKLNQSGGLHNVAIGSYSLDANTTGDYNLALGEASLGGNQDGVNNVALGQDTLLSNVGGDDNIAIGPWALDASTGDQNVAIGIDALTLTTGNANTGIGYQAGDDTTTGSNNIFIGKNVQAPTAGTSSYLNIGGAIMGDMTTGNIIVSGTAALTVPKGTNAQRPGSPASGMLRYNTDYTTNDKLEYYDAESAGWVALVGGTGSSALSSISAAAANNSINNGAWNQVWNWQLTGAETGLIFGENAASTGGASNQYIISTATLAASTATPLYVNNLGAAASFIVHDESADATPFIIDASGNVGIANPTPSVKLDITGDVEYSGTITDVSDMRLKNDITPLNTRGSMLEKMGRVETYSFTMKDDAKKQIEFGVMAQELEKIFPELVRTAPDEMGTKSVNYVGLIAPMIEAGKELEAQNKALQAEITTLKAQQGEMTEALNTISNDIKGLKAHTGYGIGKAQMGLAALLAALGMLSGLLLSRRRTGK